MDASFLIYPCCIYMKFKQTPKNKQVCSSCYADVYVNFHFPPEISSQRLLHWKYEKVNIDSWTEQSHYPEFNDIIHAAKWPVSHESLLPLKLSAIKTIKWGQLIAKLNHPESASDSIDSLGGNLKNSFNFPIICSVKLYQKGNRIHLGNVKRKSGTLMTGNKCLVNR